MRPKIAFDPAALRGEMRKAFSLITGKWKLEILWLLNQRVHRFGELKKSIPGITQHMLTAQLRELEADGLVSREIFAEVPPRVEYSITSTAHALKPVMDGAVRLVASTQRQHGRTADMRPLIRDGRDERGNVPGPLPQRRRGAGSRCQATANCGRWNGFG